MLQVVSNLTLRSIKNTVSVRDLGMVPYIKIFLDEDQYRGPALSILEQIAEINPEEFMRTCYRSPLLLYAAGGWAEAGPFAVCVEGAGDSKQFGCIQESWRLHRTALSCGGYGRSPV
ncbi:hypothetical protein fugu_013069 [Takifugu bimaculatus]|uniref:Uncharacterized protein n=1 Tax=Takifugu bimaculatus TaxID=433685 RepID=A0A4Z2C738_9TELE|nr:hypothetical protein fugu_013069 [Takifugu bimaculatus]